MIWGERGLKRTGEGCDPVFTRGRVCGTVPILTAARDFHCRMSLSWWKEHLLPEVGSGGTARLCKPLCYWRTRLKSVMSLKLFIFHVVQCTAHQEQRIKCFFAKHCGKYGCGTEPATKQTTSVCLLPLAPGLQLYLSLLLLIIMTKEMYETNKAVQIPTVYIYVWLGWPCYQYTVVCLNTLLWLADIRST